MGEQDNTNLVKQAYAHFQKGDIQALLGLCADDIEWELSAMENVPFSGKRRGRDQVAEFFRILAETQEPLQFEPREFVAQGEKVVAIGHYAWRVKSTGRQFESDWVHVFDIRGGQLANFREYMDTMVAAAAHQQSEAAHQGIGSEAAQSGGAQPPLH